MTALAIRPPAVAGMFYPGDPHALHQQLDELFGKIEQQRVDGKLIALVSPHAGYIYSGFTAAHGFTLLKGLTFDAVVIVSPSHREYFDGISVYDGDAYRTPLGDVAINDELRRLLTDGDDVISLSNSGHRQEHAVEVQIPFLQKMLKHFTILPVVMGDQRREYSFHLGKKLAHILRGRDVLLVASTDLSHYYPYQIAESLDGIVIEGVRRFDVEQLMADLEAERAEACGGGPTVAVMFAARELGANKTYILHSCNSGDVTGDRSGVVGYLSAAFTQTN